MRRFLWSNVGEENRDPLLRWKTCCLPRSSGDLDIEIVRFIIG